MTIADAAKQYGVTQQAIYQKLKRKGIKRAAIQQAGTAELTEEGESIIASLFNRDTVSVAKRSFQKTEELFNIKLQMQTLENSLKEKTEEVEQLKQTVTKLEQDTAALRDHLHEVEEERDFLRLTVSQLTETQRMTLAALQPSAHEKGLLARIKARFAKKGETSL